ncbi:MAG: hypothetical protein AAF526_10365 [Pseudomonadota bacterium]
MIKYLAALAAAAVTATLLSSAAYAEDPPSAEEKEPDPVENFWQGSRAPLSKQSAAENVAETVSSPFLAFFEMVRVIADSPNPFVEGDQEKAKW